MEDKFLINLDIIRNTNRRLQNQKKKNLSITILYFQIKISSEEVNYELAR